MRLSFPAFSCGHRDRIGKVVTGVSIFALKCQLKTSGTELLLRKKFLPQFDAVIHFAGMKSIGEIFDVKEGIA
ncbi:hypothetical protein K1719_010333 [Acacia pycnantha]|nr:hypothetical protein K1719_010333 [Acacia pycnantha]